VIAGFGTFFPILASGGPTNIPWNNAGLVVPDIASNIRVDRLGAQRKSWARCTTIARAITTPRPTA